MRLRSLRLLLVALAVALTAVACTPTKPPLRVEFWGDSMGTQAGPYFNYFIGASGKATGRTHTFPGTSLCDWISDIRAELNPANHSGFHPQAAVIEFNEFAFSKCVRNSQGVPLSGQALLNKYAADSAQVIGMFTRARVPVYFVSTPITRAEANQGDVGLDPLSRMFSQLPAKYPGGIVRFIDAGAAVLLNGHYTVTLPCLYFEKCTGRWANGTRTVVVREADGVHFCPVAEVPSGGGFTKCSVAMPGAMRYVIAMTGRILKDFHLS
jgi:hypothetical protein